MVLPERGEGEQEVMPHWTDDARSCALDKRFIT